MTTTGIQRLVLLGLLSLALSNFTSMNRSHVGAFAGGASGTAACSALGVTDAYAIGACAVIGAFKGADMLYSSDKDVHNAVFVDHLNTSPSHGQSYTNWYNRKT